MTSRRDPSVVRLVLVLLGACLAPLLVRGVLPSTEGTELATTGGAAQRAAAVRGQDAPDDPTSAAPGSAGDFSSTHADAPGAATTERPERASTTTTTTTRPRPTTTAPPTTAAPEPTTTAPASPEEGYAAEVLDLVNQARADVGCQALTVDDRLQAAAQLHAEDMSARQYMDHVNPEGLDPSDRAAAQGYTGPVGENIAMGYPSPAEVMEGWMGSEGHRANIENCDYTIIGIGVDTEGWYWAQVFGM
ncbi:MAG TPA: CAP domain-containing protein [Acidimicrobiales bacterium]